MNVSPREERASPRHCIAWPSSSSRRQRRHGSPQELATDGALHPGAGFPALEAPPITIPTLLVSSADRVKTRAWTFCRRVLPPHIREPRLFMQMDAGGRRANEERVLQFENFNNKDLLSAIAGNAAAEVLMLRFGSLTNLAQASFDELTAVPGIGESRAKAIKSAFLLAQRLAKETYLDTPLLDTPDAVANLLREANRLYTVEVFQVALLNTRRRLIAVQMVSQGTLDTLLIHPREVFFQAIQKRAAAIILAHNHPSGDPTPSEADIRITRDLIRAGQLLKIEVLDHVILGKRTETRPRDYLSLRELGYFHCV